MGRCYLTPAGSLLTHQRGTYCSPGLADSHERSSRDHKHNNRAAPTQAAEPTQPAATEPQPIVPAVTATAVSAFPASLPEAGSAAWVALPGEMELPIGIAIPADGSGRLFVLEQHGRIPVYQQDQLQTRPYLDISGRVGSNGSERGLLWPGFPFRVLLKMGTSILITRI